MLLAAKSGLLFEWNVVAPARDTGGAAELGYSNQARRRGYLIRRSIARYGLALPNGIHST